MGAGLSGLSAALDLLHAGFRVAVVDRARDFGGLASSVLVEGTPVERFYHFICRNDRALLGLVGELGLDDQLEWHHTKTSFFCEGKHYRFGNPFDLLRFDAIPPLQRLRFGAHVLSSRFRHEWRQLDLIPAKPWIIDSVGEEAYNVIWHPLLSIKFGPHHDRISAAWLWHRIWRVATSRSHLFGPETFGAFRQGSSVLVDELARRIEAHPEGRLVGGIGIRSISHGEAVSGVVLDSGEEILADSVISTAPLPILDQLLGSPTGAYFDRLRRIEYIGVVCLMLSLRENVSSSFWLNINDHRISFNGIISQSNLNVELRRRGLHIAYVPFYLPTNHPRYRASDAEIRREVLDLLPLVNPAFSESWVKETELSRAHYAQAVCTTGFASLIPDHRSPIRNLYVTDSAQFYPEDRTLSQAIEQGRRAARCAIEDRG
jgi:protoporphyrinogen oxidase